MKKENQKMKIKEKGITLIALVITIVVLLILARVTIATLTRENGILNKATEAKEQTKQAKEDELRKLTVLEAALYIEEHEYEDSSGKIITIPAQCAVSQVEGENTLENGLVIIDKNGNEWVWIEVPKNIYTTAQSNTDYENIKADLITYAGIYRNGSSSQSYNWVDEWYDGNGKIKSESNNLEDNSGCGLTEIEYTMLYNRMLRSVYENGGFWLGRYEAGVSKMYPRIQEGEVTEVAHIQKDMYPYNFVTCVQAQVLASDVKVNTTKTSSLLFGIQWDLICRFLDDKGVNTANINFDSSNCGNYSNSSFNLNRGKYAQKGNLSLEWNYYKKDLENCVINTKKQSNLESNCSIIYTTGASDTNYLMNIYDLGGNVWEWTLEYGSLSARAEVNRGGAYNGTGLNSPISIRNRPTAMGSSFHNVGFRVTMY